jgi:hypothetical protein
MNAPRMPRPEEIAAATQKLRVDATDPVKLTHLLRELVVARNALRIVRLQRRCLPRHAQEALDHTRPAHSAAVEFAHD